MPVSEPMALRGIADLSDARLTAVLDRAHHYASGGTSPRTSAVVGLLFFEASLRTRAGFAAAAHRLGAGVVEVNERRSSEISMPESSTDTVRTLSGYVDVLVVRSPQPTVDLQQAARPDTGWLNAGDRGLHAEHPSQALIDFFAMERILGPVEDLHVALCGDLRMRSARSLLALLARRRPRALSLVTDPSLTADFELPAALRETAGFVEPAELEGVSVLHAVGIAHRAATEDVRRALRVDRRLLATLGPDALVMSAMPIIDEVASSVRTAPQMRYFEQSDLGLFVRMALLDLFMGRFG